MTESRGVWLYAVTRGFSPQDLAGLTGVGGEPVRAVEADGLVAVVSSVSLDEFGQEALRRNLEDLDWLAATARAHDGVVEAVVRAGPAVPLRLATVYLGDERVRDEVRARRADLEAALNRVAGRTEWGVKVYCGPSSYPEPAVADGGAPGRGAGTTYLLRRRAQLSARETAERNAAAQADEVHTALGGVAVAGRKHLPQDPRLSGERAWMVLNGAYLVDNSRADQFAMAVTDLERQHRGLRFELTGPWPPYSFTGIGEDGR